ncbi:MAG: UMP kinase [Oligoflexales bacterium]
MSQRVMLKLSGEMLGGQDHSNFNADALSLIAHEIQSLHEADYEVAAVIGGGNIWRGAIASEFGMNRASADYMGMLATCINALALQEVLENRCNIPTRVMTSLGIPELAEPYIRRRADKHLKNKSIVLFAGGTGNPFFTTDTAASLRAREIGAHMILKATKVDGIYDKDPLKHPDAKRYQTLSYLDVISQKLGVMDATAMTMCMESHIPIKVFKLDSPGCVLNAIQNPEVGTTVK